MSAAITPRPLACAVLLAGLCGAGAGAARALCAQETPPQAPVPTMRVPPPLPRPWRFGLEIGFTDISGNRDLQLFHGAFTIEQQRRDEYIFNGKLEVRYGESNNAAAVDNSVLRLRFDWRPRSVISPFVGFDVERDRIRRIDSRVSGGTGANLNFIRGDTRHATLAIGLIGEFENRQASITPRYLEDTRFHTRLAYFRVIRAGTRVELNAKYQPATSDMSDYLASADGAVAVALNTKFSLRTRYEWKRDSTPAPGVKSKDDRNLTVMLLVSF